MKKLLLFAAGIVVMAGCGSDNGDVEAARRASEAIPKSVDQLPSDMPEEAKQSAANALAQGQAMQQQQQGEADARTRAMQEMQKQRGGG